MVSKPGANVIGSSSDTNDLKVRSPQGWIGRQLHRWSSLSQTFASSDLSKPKDSQAKFLSTSEYSTDPWKTASIETEHVLPTILLGASSFRQDSKNLNYLFHLKLKKYFFCLIAGNKTYHIYNQIRIWPLPRKKNNLLLFRMQNRRHHQNVLNILVLLA